MKPKKTTLREKAIMNNIRKNQQNTAQRKRRPRTYGMIKTQRNNAEHSVDLTKKEIPSFRRPGF